jgi:DNA-binding PadR family transcriptional regulator
MPKFKHYQTGKHLEAFVLLLLTQKPDHGGHLLLRLSALLPQEWALDSGRIYRLLRELEESGFLFSSWTQHDDTAPVRQYQITPQGASRLDNWAQELAVKQALLSRFLVLHQEITSSSAMGESPKLSESPKTG